MKVEENGIGKKTHTHLSTRQQKQSAVELLV